MRRVARPATGSTSGRWTAGRWAPTRSTAQLSRPDGLPKSCAPVEVVSRRGTVLVETDECPRPTTTLAKIEALPPVFGSGTITAGNAPGLNDGAAAMVVMTADRARELGLEPIAEIVELAEATDDPEGIAWIPALTIQKVLERAQLSVDDLELIEINEAFAAMPLVSTRILAGGTADAANREEGELRGPLAVTVGADQRQRRRGWRSAIRWVCPACGS